MNTKKTSQDQLNDFCPPICSLNILPLCLMWKSQQFLNLAKCVLRNVYGLTLSIMAALVDFARYFAVWINLLIDAINCYTNAFLTTPTRSRVFYKHQAQWLHLISASTQRFDLYLKFCFLPFHSLVSERLFLCLKINQSCDLHSAHHHSTVLTLVKSLNVP